MAPQRKTRSSRLAALLLGVAVACGGSATPVQRAVVLSEAGREHEAIGVLRAYLDIHPEAIAERRMLIRLYGAVGDLARAEREVALLSRYLGEASVVSWIEKGYVLELAHRYDEALAMYDRAATLAPTDPTGPRVGGLRAARWGEAALAEGRLEEAAKRDPNDAEVWHALGVVRMHLGDVAQARRAYKEGLRADPRAIENRLGLATAAFELGEPAVALAQYERILAERPRYRDAELGRSWALILLGRYAEARVALGAARNQGADPDVIRSQMRVLRRLEARSLRGDNH